MYLKKLELFGFKSFAEKTELIFEPGIVAIVGPNGCGKSNIADALRWVLGEQSTRSLRGMRMEDVIFNGSDKRKLLGMAEVSLTLLNTEKILPIDYSEVKITRRLFRSGESEFYLNKTPCRLRDIAELFMDTGMGPDAYSIIEQESIDLILNSKPIDRRFLFEEAAGITKYRSRRREVLRKLEGTELNLVRVNDIIGEVKRQLDSLEKQVEQARRYTQYRDELKGLEIKRGRSEFASLNNDYRKGEGLLTEFKAKMEGMARELAQREGRCRELKVSLMELEERAKEAEEEVRQVKDTIEELESKIVVTKERLYGLEELRRRTREEIDYLEESFLNTENRLSAVERSLEEVSLRIREKEASLSNREDCYYQIKNKFKANEDLLDRLKKEALSLREEAAQIHKGLEKVGAERLSLGVKIKELRAHQAKLEEERRFKNDELRKRGLELENLRSNLNSLQKERDALQLSLSGKEIHLSQLKRKLEELKERIDFKISQCHLWEELGKRGILGTIADLFTTSKKYERAIKAALGENLSGLVVETLNNALAVIDYLKDQEKVSCFVLDLLKNSSIHPLKVELPTQEETLIPALKVVKVDSQYQMVFEFLLGNTVIASDLKLALKAKEELAPKIKIVTLTGELLDPMGIITVTSKGDNPVLYKGRVEIEKLNQESEYLKGEIANITQEQSKTEEETKRIRDQIKDIETRYVQGQTLTLEREKELIQVEAEIKGFGDRLAILKSEEVEVAKKEVELEIKENGLKEPLAELERKVEAKDVEITNLQREIEKGKEEGERVLKEVTELKILLASLREKHEHLVSDLEELKIIQGELTGNLKRRKEDYLSLGMKEEELKRTIKVVEEALAQRSVEKSRGEKIREDIQAEIRKLKLELATEEDRIREERGAYGNLQNQLHRQEMKLTQVEMRINNLKERMRDEYGLLLEIDREENKGERINPKELLARINVLKTELEALGPVNLIALEEYNKLKERYDFLSEQQADLLKAKESLYKMIELINYTTRERFLETFKTIAAKFEVIFKRLFNGGEARLVLTNEGDPLESGIDIVAQPPGKRLQNLSLLSGGEKALIAIALLFAIFMTKPSPFCVLDELDAPLDDANIERFIALVKDFGQKTQFIIITHNRRTMEASDVLYGVTMEEPGVSKIVSLRIKGKDKELPAQGEVNNVS